MLPIKLILILTYIFSFTFSGLGYTTQLDNSSQLLIFAPPNAGGPVWAPPIQFINEANITKTHNKTQGTSTVMNGIFHVDKILKPPFKLSKSNNTFTSYLGGNYEAHSNEITNKDIPIMAYLTGLEKKETTINNAMDGIIYSTLKQYPEIYSTICSYLRKDDEMFNLTSQIPPPETTGLIPRVTFFAPTNDAFEKLDPSIRNKLD